jgi:hypothetical protein
MFFKLFNMRNLLSLCAIGGTVSMIACNNGMEKNGMTNEDSSEKGQEASKDEEFFNRENHSKYLESASTLRNEGMINQKLLEDAIDGEWAAYSIYRLAEKVKKLYGDYGDYTHLSGKILYELAWTTEYAEHVHKIPGGLIPNFAIIYGPELICMPINFSRVVADYFEESNRINLVCYAKYGKPIFSSEYLDIVKAFDPFCFNNKMKDVKLILDRSPTIDVFAQELRSFYKSDEEMNRYVKCKINEMEAFISKVKKNGMINEVSSEKAQEASESEELFDASKVGIYYDTVVNLVNCKAVDSKVLDSKQDLQGALSYEWIWYGLHRLSTEVEKLYGFPGDYTGFSIKALEELGRQTYVLEHVSGIPGGLLGPFAKVHGPNLIHMPEVFERAYPHFISAVHMMCKEYYKKHSKHLFTVENIDLVKAFDGFCFTDQIMKIHNLIKTVNDSEQLEKELRREYKSDARINKYVEQEVYEWRNSYDKCKRK